MPESNAPGVASPPDYRLLWHEAEITVRRVTRRFTGDLVSFEVWERRITQRIGTKEPKRVVTFNSVLKRYYQLATLGGGTLLTKREERTGQFWRTNASSVRSKWGLDGAESLRRAGHDRVRITEGDVYPTHEFQRLIDAERGIVSQPSSLDLWSGHSSLINGLPAGIKLSEPLTQALSGIYATSSDPLQIIALYRARRRYTYRPLRLTASRYVRELGVLGARREGGGISLSSAVVAGSKGAASPEPKDPPTIISLVWTDHECIGELSDLRYYQRVRLVGRIENANGSWATITVKRQDGKDLKAGLSRRVFSVFITNAGDTETSLFEIDPTWETSEHGHVEWLVATIEHDGQCKESKVVCVTPTPKVIVNFRPHAGWSGEFGFDWIREADTKRFGTAMFGDNEYEKIVSKQYLTASHNTLQPNGNEYMGSYKQDPVQFEALKRQYKRYPVPWATTDATGQPTPADYLAPWMSIYSGKKAEIRLLLDVKDEAEYLEFEKNANFKCTPERIDVSGKVGAVALSATVEIECLQEFSSDETIAIYACQQVSDAVITKVPAGKITVWANAASRQQETKVVFVQVATPGGSPSTPPPKGIATNDEKNIRKYMRQAYINLHKDAKIVDLNLSSNPVMANWINAGGKVITRIKGSTDTLEGFLKSELSKTYSKKYDDYFKAFYFGTSGDGLNGYSVPGQGFVVIFPSANQQTAAHEFLHAFNLPHTFTNRETEKYALFTYEAKKTDNLMDYSHMVSRNGRCGLWHWQWKIANSSV